MLQQNTKPQSAGIITACLCSKGVQVLHWPACSLDLSPIENVQDIIKLKVRQQSHFTVEQLNPTSSTNGTTSHFPNYSKYSRSYEYVVFVLLSDKYGVLMFYKSLYSVSNYILHSIQSFFGNRVALRYLITRSYHLVNTSYAPVNHHHNNITINII